MSDYPWNIVLAQKILNRSKILALKLTEGNGVKLNRQRTTAIYLNCLMLECQIAIVTLINAGCEAEKKAVDDFIALLMSLFMKEREIPQKYHPKMTKLALRHLGKTWRLTLFPEDPQSEESFGKSVVGRTVYYLLKNLPLLGRKKRFASVLRTLTFSTSDAMEGKVYLEK